MEIAINAAYRGQDVAAQLDAAGLVKHVLSAEGVPDNAEVSVSFVTNDAVRELNQTYRGIDRPTDVLSFECDGVQDGFSHVDTGEPYELGDIVIAVDIAESQAPEYGLSFADELSLLVTHGMLHLCGYDHVADEEAEAMEARETELLSSFWGKPFKRHNVES